MRRHVVRGRLVLACLYAFLLILPAAGFCRDWVDAYDQDAIACRSSCARQFSRLAGTSGTIDTVVTVRIRGFGSKKELFADLSR